MNQVMTNPPMKNPATAMNDQATSLVWRPALVGQAWLKKRRDTKVTPDGWLQPIIDSVDPTKDPAMRPPGRS